MTDDATTASEPDGTSGAGTQSDDSRSSKSRVTLLVGAAIVALVLLVTLFVATQDSGYDGPINGDAATFDEFTADFPDACVVSPQPQDESTGHAVYCKGEALGIPTLPGQIVYQWQEQMPDEDLLAEWGRDTCGLVSGRTVVDYYEPQQNSRSLDAALRDFVDTVPQTFHGEVTVTEACP